MAAITLHIGSFSGPFAKRTAVIAAFFGFAVAGWMSAFFFVSH
jgi:hypothetical protein